MCVWDTETGELKKQWHLHAGPVLDVDWAPVFVANTSGKNRDPTSQQSTDPDNQYLFASCSTDGQIFIVDVRDEGPGTAESVAASAAEAALSLSSSAVPKSRCEPRLLQGHEGEVNSVSWDPTGTLLLSSSDDCTVKIWSASSGDILHDLIDHEKEVLTARWSGTGPCTEHHKFPLFIATGSTDTTVKLFDPNSGHCLHTLTQHTHPVSQLAFAPKQQLLATASHERVFIWSLSTGTLLKTFKNLGDPLIQTPNHIPLGQVGGLNDLAFDSKGEQLAVSYADGMTYVIDLQTEAK
jgi:WD40 repeat protein